jgi:hypothetical protein
MDRAKVAALPPAKPATQPSRLPRPMPPNGRQVALTSELIRASSISLG